ncbi:MAG TPA: DUF599 family protein [Candidatus Competibacteraceae bacterium]|nr:DUF599 family protein [Candidatus Competibacteraceae bacterium]
MSELLSLLTPLDRAAVAWFLLCWLGYAWLADHTRLHRRSISAAMGEYRRRWMLTMLRREVRIVDTAIQGILLQGVAFFASTTILLIGALFAMLRAGDQAMQVLSQLPFVVPTSPAQWELKLLLLVAIFIYAFFKFAWAFRLFNYCSILIGATPLAEPEREPPPEAMAHVEQVAQLNIRAAYHFNNGVRAYFFAFAAIGWFLHPWLFMLLSAWVVVVLQRREFRSQSYGIVRPSCPPAT